MPRPFGYYISYMDIKVDFVAGIFIEIRFEVYQKVQNGKNHA